MKRGFVFIAVLATLWVGGMAYAASFVHWRPVMPAFIIEASAPPAAPRKEPSLMLIYGEEGTDPLRNGTLARDQRISSCALEDGRCISAPARHEFHADGPHAQSLQIRLRGPAANPIIGAVRWNGPAHPSRVRVACDFRVPEPSKACRVLSQEL